MDRRARSICFQRITGSGELCRGNDVTLVVCDSELSPSQIRNMEDILDSGRTLSYLMETLRESGAASISLCTFLDKPERRVVPVHVDYCGFQVPDEFIVGYGLDYAQRFRNLPFVGILKPEVYSD